MTASDVFLRLPPPPADLVFSAADLLAATAKTLAGGDGWRASALLRAAWDRSARRRMRGDSLRKVEVLRALRRGLRVPLAALREAQGLVYANSPATERPRAA
jgi:hypothetical protein